MKADCYVMIPAYRDRELVPTLRDLFRQASQPRRLRVAVAWQRDESDHIPSDLARRKNLEILDLPAATSRGPNWARRLLQDRYGGERYTLCLDSHHRFVPGWDRRLTGMYESLRKSGVAKPLITAYLPPYDPARDPAGRVRELLKIYPLGRTRGLLTHLTGRPLPFPGSIRSPLPAGFLSLHFLFAGGEFNREIPFDPKIYFFGDEVFTGLRAYLGGYEMFQPHRILGWHLYDRGTRVPHWDDHDSWRRRESRSFQRMCAFVERERKRAGPTACNRTLAGYEGRIGQRLIE